MVDYAQDQAFQEWLAGRIEKINTGGGTLVNVASFGILPTNSAPANDVGFAALKTMMKAAPATTWQPQFSPGAYTYTNNRWLYGVLKVIVDAYDCTFQCITPDSNNANGQPLWNGGIFDASGDTPWPHASYTTGYKFSTAQAGALSITTTTAADAGNFAAGDPVLLYGYDQQGSGYPPNPRYFEYKEVLTANAGTGVVTFVDPVKLFYDSRWWDTLYSDGVGALQGAPRILNLHRGNFTHPTLIWIKGATFLANPVTPASNALVVVAKQVIYTDVTAPHINIGECGSVYLKRCFGDGYGIVPDKVVDSLVVEHSIADGVSSGNTQSMSNGQGCNSIALIRSKFYGAIYQVGPRALQVSGCDIYPVPANAAGINSTSGSAPIRALSVDNTRVFNSGQSLGVGIKAPPGLSLTVGSVVGTDIRIPFDATGIAVAYQIDYGMTITNTVTGNIGIITAIYYETGSPGTLRIAGTWAPPSPGDIFYYYDVIQASDGGGNVIVGTQIPFWRTAPRTANAGNVSLVGGTATVTNTVVRNDSHRIILARHAVGGTLGHLSYSIIDGTSFTITSSSNTETSTIEWWLHPNF